MKIIFTILVVMLNVRFSEAQNLVLNPGLESYITCPGFGQFSNTYIDNWDKPSYGSTDYYHDSCAGIIPSQQIPRSGNAYAGIIGYNYGQEYREYMTGMLSSPLIPGATYYCEFYVSLNDGYIQAIKEIGAYFSSSFPGPYLNTLHIPVTPQIENTVTLLDDTSSWMRISGYFLALSGEQYITIGNFNNDSTTSIVQVGSSGSFGSYYFVDDVWVSLSEGTGLPHLDADQIKVFPNPSGGQLSIRCASQIDLALIFNSMGEEILSITDYSSGSAIDLSNIPGGIYYLEIRSGENVFRKKIIRE